MRFVPTMNARRVAVSVLQGSASITTVLRLIQRSCSHRLWWDDFWSFCAMLCSVVSACVFLLPPRASPGTGNISAEDPILVEVVKPSVMVTILVFYLAGLWFARISIAVTIVRLLSDGRLKTAAKTVSLFFGLSGSLLIAVRIVNCGTELDKAPVCKIPRYVAYVDLSLDILADMWLTIAPVVMLSRTSISHKHRRLIAGIFGCGSLITATSILHITYLVTEEHLMKALTAHIQLGVAIILCNFLVLVPYIYHKYRSWTLESTRLSNTVPTHRQTRHPNTRSGLTPSESSPSAAVEHALGAETGHFSLTELGSSMLGGSSRDMTSFGLHATASIPAPRPAEECGRSLSRQTGDFKIF